MNLISILLLVLILGAAVLVIYRRVRHSSRKASCCDSCDVEGCSLRDLLRKRDGAQHDTEHTEKKD
jgi:hypothetical protein